MAIGYGYNPKTNKETLTPQQKAAVQAVTSSSSSSRPTSTPPSSATTAALLPVAPSRPDLWQQAENMMGQTVTVKVQPLNV
jgi:hypothetical protein